jgi:hypothetical protein
VPLWLLAHNGKFYTVQAFHTIVSPSASSLVGLKPNLSKKRYTIVPLWLAQNGKFFNSASLTGILY